MRLAVQVVKMLSQLSQSLSSEFVASVTSLTCIYHLEPMNQACCPSRRM